MPILDRRRPGDDDDGDRYLTLTALSHYSGLSTSTLKRCIRDPKHPLPHYLVGTGRGRLVVRKSHFDTWMEANRPARSPRPPRDHGPRDPHDPSWMQRAFKK